MLGIHNLRLAEHAIVDAIVRFTSACGAPKFLLVPLERYDEALAIAAGLPHRQNGLETPLQVIPLPPHAPWGLANHGNAIFHHADGPAVMERPDLPDERLAAAAMPIEAPPPPAEAPKVHEDPAEPMSEAELAEVQRRVRALNDGADNSVQTSATPQTVGLASSETNAQGQPPAPGAAMEPVSGAARSPDPLSDTSGQPA